MSGMVSVKNSTIILVLLVVVLNGRSALSHIFSNIGSLTLNHELALAPADYDLETLASIEETMSQATSLAATNQSAWRALGFAQLFQGHEPEAVEAWQTAGNMSDELILWGNKFYARQHFGEAIVWYNRARDVASQSAKPLYYLGLVAASQENWSEAIDLFQQAKAQPDSQAIAASLDFQMGQILYLQQDSPDLDTSLALFDQALASDQFIQTRERLDARYFRGDILRQQGLTAEARREFVAVVNKEPTHYRANVWLGEFAWRLDGDLEMAESHWNRMIAIHPELLWAQQRLAKAYVEAGRIDEAVGVYERILEISPENQTAATFLATQN